MSYVNFHPEDFIENTLIDSVDWAVANIFNNDEVVGILIDGTPGTGKTTNGSLLAKHLQPNFDIENQIGRGIEQFVKAYNYTADSVKVKKNNYVRGKTKATLKVCVYDEANDSDKGSSRGKIQKLLLNLLSGTARQDGIILIIILHRFYRLDEKFFDNGLIDILINFDYKVNKHYSHFRCFDLDSLLWMSSQIKRGKISKKPEVYKISSPNFYGKFIYAPDDFSDDVRSLSKIGKDSMRRKSTRAIHSENYYSISVLAGMLGQTRSSVEYRIKKLNLSKMYLKERSGKTLFFDKDVYSVLKKVYSKEEEDLIKRK